VAPAPSGTLEATEREAIVRTLRETNWVLGGPRGAATRLGLKRTTLQSRMQRLGIRRSER
jgi:formate hydrogenlyase transcriptional activator